MSTSSLGHRRVEGYSNGEVREDKFQNVTRFKAYQAGYQIAYDSLRDLEEEIPIIHLLRVSKEDKFLWCKMKF